MKNIILCGGNGTRLWPLSRTLMPKQFVKLFGDDKFAKEDYLVTFGIKPEYPETGFGYIESDGENLI